MVLHYYIIIDNVSFVIETDKPQYNYKRSINVHKVCHAPGEMSKKV